LPLHNRFSDRIIPMLLTCPSCETSFRVNPEALGPSGRRVRCACCQTSWFALPAEAGVEPAMVETPAVGVDSTDLPAVAADDPISWHEPAESEAPSLALDDVQAATPEEADEDVAEAEIIPARKALPPRPAPRKSSRKGLGVAALAAAGAFAALAIAARATVVRAIPDLAGVYAAVGLPVNFRGLEFRDVRTTSETQDGITVLVIEGEVVNVARHAVEVPRVRLAVLGNGGQELYSWTTLLPRSMLSEDEKVSFRSRLASPPPDGREVLVRFLTRSDLTDGR
jgi:predicted Zn finger-like uncharacterized protein